MKKNTRLFSRFPGSSFFARTAAVFLLLLLLLAIPLFVLISQQRQTIKQQAATPSPSIKPLPSSQRSPSSYPLLPGQQIWKNGVSSYIFGTNNTYPFSNQNIETVPAVQQALKDAHIPLIRTWFFSPANADYPQWATDAEIDKRLQVDEFIGAQCLGVLRDISPASFAFYKHVVQYAGNRCNIYEYGNEPGNEGEPGMSTYITSWNTLIPQLRQINPNAKFIGPVNGVSDIATLLKAAQISGVYPDGVSFHEYSNDPAVFGKEITQAKQLVKSIIGRDLPVGITEWNFGLGSSNGSNPAFMTQFTTAALNGLIAAHADFATQFTALNSARSRLNMFDPSGQPRAQYYAMKAMIAQYITNSSSP